MVDVGLRRVAVIRRPQDDVEAVIADDFGIGAQDAQVDVAETGHDALDAGNAVAAVGHDFDLIAAKTRAEVGHDFIEVEVLFALRLSDEIVVIGLIGNAELGIIEIGPQFRNQRQFPALGQLVERRIINGKTRNAGIAGHLKGRIQIVAVVAGHQDDGIEVHRLFNCRRLFFYGIALYAQADRRDETDEHDQHHHPHTAFIYVCHSLHLIYELLTWP